MSANILWVNKSQLYVFVGEFGGSEHVCMDYRTTFRNPNIEDGCRRTVNGMAIRASGASILSSS
jgi:hypothetical protein